MKAFEYTMLKEGEGRRREEDGTTKVCTVYIVQKLNYSGHFRFLLPAAILD